MQFTHNQKINFKLDDNNRWQQGKIYNIDDRHCFIEFEHKGILKRVCILKFHLKKFQRDYNLYRLGAKV